MKIRIQNNSLRLRLSKSDMAKLDESGIIISRSHISETTILKFELCVSASDNYDVRFQDNSTVIEIPKSQKEYLLVENNVGFNFTFDNGQNDGLYILIEKDFQCLIPRDTDVASNLYPNPLSK